MKGLFSPNAPHQHIARSIAIVWTLLIFVLCLMPSHQVPKVSVPLADKWTHFVLFGVFSFAWCAARPGASARYSWLVLLWSVFLGCFIEYLQGYFASLGRSPEVMDAVADAIGGGLGVVLFALGRRLAR
jgi:VanZ family protein